VLHKIPQVLREIYETDEKSESVSANFCYFLFKRIGSKDEKQTSHLVYLGKRRGFVKGGLTLIIF
jgi:hypothetical protein